ncbi:hypothetical protein G6F56_004406 [Rhizopus delemar]|nr:hypothetical protein G6F56_004406 [Rhizopus delemar]
MRGDQLLIVAEQGNSKTTEFNLLWVAEFSKSQVGVEDTTSSQLSLSSIYFKLDFRVIIEDINTRELDVATGEFARKSVTTSSKVYHDLLKSTLTTKAYLNAVLKRIPYINQINVKNVVMPMIQVTGLYCIVYGMNVIDKKIYSLQRLRMFYYPSTEHEIKNGTIKTMLDEFALVERGIRKNANNKTIDINEYISTVYTCSDEDEDEEDEKGKENCYNEEEYLCCHNAPINSNQL